MRKLDLHWMTNKEWWEFCDHIPTVKASAPPEAQQSYARYLEQSRQWDEAYPDLETEQPE